MSELPDTDVWTGEQRRKTTGRAKQIHWDAYELNTGAKCHKLTLCVCTEMWSLQTKYLQWVLPGWSLVDNGYFLQYCDINAVESRLQRRSYNFNS